MRKDLLFIFLGLISGIGFFILDENMGIFLPILIFAVGVFLLFQKSSTSYFFMALSLGMVLSLASFNSYNLLSKEEANLNITITEKKISNNRYTYFVKAKNKSISEKSVFYSEENFDIGEELNVDAEVSLTNKNSNPYLFNYRSYLLTKKVKSQLEIEKINSKKITKNPFLKIKNNFYKYVHKVFSKNLSKKSSDFVISILLADDILNEDSISELGLSHILAVSGLHIDLLITFFLFLSKKFKIDYKVALVFSTLVSIFYGFLISFPFSVQRVIILNIISLLAFLLKRPYDKIRALMLSAIFILLINPFAVLSSGFVLSFVACGSIYLIYPKIKKYFSKNILQESLAFALSLQIGLFPFIIYYFSRINLLSFFANFILLDIFEISMYLIFGLLIFYPIAGKGLLIFFKILDSLLKIILEVTKFLASFSIFRIDFQKPSFLLSLAFFAFIIFMANKKIREKKVLSAFCGIILIILCGSLSIEDKNPSFSMIDIGQGDALILNDSGDYYLFDLGGPKFKNYDSGEKVMLPLLKSMGVKRIKGVFLSHLDMDHSGNLDTIFNNFKVDRVYSSYLNKDRLKGYNFYPLKLNDKIKLKKSSIKVVFDGIDNNDENNKSLGLLININGFKILTLGDLPSVYEDNLNLRADILKVSHHGSRYSTSEKFVKDVKPKVSLISAGRNNIYGHPTMEVLNNLNNSKIYQTPKDGFVNIKFHEDYFEVDPYLKGGFFR